MPRTTDAPGGPESRTPWWLDEMIDRANSGRGRYEIAIPATVLEDWIANIRPALAALAAARPVVSAALAWCHTYAVRDLTPEEFALMTAVAAWEDALAAREDNEGDAG